MKSKVSCLALVCVSIKFIDFIFISLFTHFKRKTKKNIQKQTTTKKKQKKNKTKQNNNKNKQKQTNKQNKTK